ncbi:MAG: GMP synthase [Desulfurococcaceae archaeon]
MTSVLGVEKLVASIVENLKAVASNIDCAVACVSGGIDSTTSAILAKRALGDVVYPVFIDTGFMRLNEATRVRAALSGLITLEVYDFSEYFLSRLEGLNDAEEKRIAFRDLFYTAVKKVAEEKGCSWVVQGTIKADVVETVGGVKTQHNVLNEQLLGKYGLMVIEPLVDLYKHEVRAVARYLGLPEYITERQPFPGPGLLVRTVGRLRRNKLELVRKLTDVVENSFVNKGYSQYFPAVWEYSVVESSSTNGVEYSVHGVKVTGVFEGKRSYGHPLVVEKWPRNVDVYGLYREFDTVEYPHILVTLAEKESGSYLVALRVVKTENFIVAEVPRIEFGVLRALADRILENPEVKAVAFDVTPKPPATIEYE